MAGVTLVQAEAQLALWVAASAAVASGQSYSIKDRSLSRVDRVSLLRPKILKIIGEARNYYIGSENGRNYREP